MAERAGYTNGYGGFPIRNECLIVSCSAGVCLGAIQGRSGGDTLPLGANPALGFGIAAFEPFPLGVVGGRLGRTASELLRNLVRPRLASLGGPGPRFAGGSL